MFQEGQTIGDFEILACLGAKDGAGMYKARQVSMDRVVALKTMRGGAASNPEAVARFRREAKVAGALSHPDVVAAYAAGETEGVHWVAMEFVEGTTAQARLQRKGKLALAEAVAIGTHVAGALDYGWRKGRLIHGSIGPETILLSKKSEVKLAGLGFGHALGEGRPFDPQGAATGAAHYLSPERAEGKADADFRADIYSLGCTLFHLIGGETPYQGDTALAVILHHVTMPVPQLRTVRPECPEEISRVVMKMMHKLPTGRHQTYEELIADLRRCYEAVAKMPAGVPPAASAPAAGPIAPPPKESIGPPPVAKPSPSRESIPASIRQVVPVAKLEAPRIEAAKALPVLPKESEEVEEVEEWEEERPRSLRMPLLIGGAALLAGIAGLVFFGPWKRGEQLSEAQRAQLNRPPGQMAGSPKVSPAPKPPAPKPTPVAPKPAPTPTPARVASAQPAATPEPAPAPAPAPAPVPEPMVTPAPQSATAQWLAEQEPQWQAAFASEVGGPFEKAVAELKAKHLATVERELATLPPAEDRTSGVAFRAERARMAAGGNVPAEDESMAPPSLRALRTTYRTAFAKLDTERFAKAKVVFARHDAILAKAQAGLTQGRRTAEAQEIQAKREALRTEWVKPLAASAEPAVAETPAPAAEPVPLKPAAPGPKLPRLAPRDLVQRLLAMGATVSIGRTGALTPIGKVGDLPGERFTIAKVEIIPGGEMSASDLDLIEQLSDVEELQLTGVPATDATLKLLRNLPVLHSLTLRDLKGITVAGFRYVATLPALKTLSVRGPVGAESLTAFVANRKLESLTLDDVIFTEQDFGAIAGIPALKNFTISTRDPVVTGAWGRLTMAKKLSTLNAEKTPKSAEMIAQISRCAALTTLSLGDVVLQDSDLAPLAGLKALTSLRTTEKSTMDGSVFAAWPPNLKMKTLTFPSTASASDKTLRGIAGAFPTLSRLDLRADADSVTPSGFAHLLKLKHLNWLTITGNAVDPAALGHIASLTEITHLDIGSPRLTEADVRHLMKLPSLRELAWNNPPLTEGALKGFAKLRGLTQFKVGGKVRPEDIEKLAKVLPSTKVTP